MLPALFHYKPNPIRPSQLLLTNCRRNLNPSRIHKPRPALQEATGEKENRFFSAAKTIDSRSSEEGIDAEKTYVIPSRCGWSRRMQSAYGGSPRAEGSGNCGG